MYCTNCGEKIIDTAVFCPNCGSMIDYPDQETNTSIYEDSEKSLRKTSASHVKKTGRKRILYAGIAAVIISAVLITLNITVVISSKNTKNQDDVESSIPENSSNERFEEKELSDVTEDTEIIVPDESSRTFIIRFENTEAEIKVTDVSFDENGELTVTIESDDITGAPIRNGSIIVPYQVKVTTGGKELDWHTVNISTGSLKFTYHTSVLPESLTLFGYGNESSGTTVSYESLFGPESAAEVISQLFNLIND